MEMIMIMDVQNVFLGILLYIIQKIVLHKKKLK